MTRHEVLRCSVCMSLISDKFETKTGFVNVTLVVWATGSSYQMCPRGFESVVYDGVGVTCTSIVIFVSVSRWRFEPPDWPSRPDRLSAKEALQGDPSKPLSGRWEPRLVVRGTMSSIYAGEQKNTVAVEAWGLMVRPVVFKVFIPTHRVPGF